MPGRILSKLAYYVRLTRAGDLGVLWTDLRRWTWSEDREYGLSRTLAVACNAPAARIAIDVRPLTPALAATVLSTGGLDQAARREVEVRRRLWGERIGTAYVALDCDENPCLVAWTIPGSEADHVDRFFRGGYPHLEPDELLVAGVWTLPRARGQRIMSAAVHRMTEDAARHEHRRAIAFVNVTNLRSLRGLYSAGYRVYTERTNRWRFGRRSVSWLPVTAPIAFRGND